MNAQNTPGPWGTRGLNSTFVINKNGHLIADVYATQYADEVNELPGIAHANARLIASAPELLEALIGCKGAISRLIDKYNPDDIEAEWIAEANEAIRKATM